MYALPGAAGAQGYFPMPDVEVYDDGELMMNGFAGGMTAPQFGKIDVDMDGQMDIVVFDRYNDRLFVFLLADGEYKYKPALSSLFPSGLDNWMLLRDFNMDGKTDLFTSTPLGMELYVNTGNEEEGLRWRKYHDRNPAPSPLLTQGFNSIINLQLNATDIPAIDDVDNDGDIDILVFRFAGGSTVEWHRNFSIERADNTDSLQLERVTSAWGAFRECICGTFAFDNADCPPVSGRPLHEGGKTLTTLDLDGDGDKDAIVSEETCDNIFFLQNDGDPAEAYMSMVIENYLQDPQPFFPAAYAEDINNDGRADLIVASNWPSVREPIVERVNYYTNTGTAEDPDFSLSDDRFLIGSMIDGGALSHPVFYDVNGDGALDLILGTYKTEVDGPFWTGLRLYLNTGTPGAPSFRLEDPDYLSLSEQQFLQLRPYVMDLNNDGITDLCFTAIKAGLGHRLYWMRGTGNSRDPFQGSPSPIFNELGEQDVISFQDEDDDGTPDLLVGRVTGSVELYRGETSGQNTLLFNFVRSGVYGLGTDSFRGATFILEEDVDGNGENDLLRADSRGGMAWLPSISETNEWREIVIYADKDRTGIHNPGRNLAPVTANILGLSRNQLIIGSGSGGLQVLSPLDATEQPMDEDPSLILFPNPAESSEFIRVRSSQHARLQVADVTGRIIGTYNSLAAGQTLTIPADSIASGVYIITAIYQDARRISKRLIIL